MARQENWSISAKHNVTEDPGVLENVLVNTNEVDSRIAAFGNVCQINFAFVQLLDW